MVVCPYKDKCSSYPHRCQFCKHNEEQDYFEPKSIKFVWQVEKYSSTPTDKYCEICGQPIEFCRGIHVVC